MKHRFQPQIDRAELDLAHSTQEYLAALTSLRAIEATAYRTIATVRAVQASRAEATRLYGEVAVKARTLDRWTRGAPIGQRHETRSTEERRS